MSEREPAMTLETECAVLTNADVTAGPAAARSAEAEQCSKCGATEVAVTRTRPLRFLNWIIGALLYIVVARHSGILGVIVAALAWSLADAILSGLAGEDVRSCAKCSAAWRTRRGRRGETA